MNPQVSRSGPNFTAAELGDARAWKAYTAEVAALPGVTVPGKFFLHDVLGLTGMEISVNCLPAGGKVPFFHTHRAHEEVYLVLAGSGQFQIDGELIDVGPGSALRVAPEGARTWRNRGNEPLYYIVIQATAASLTTPGTADGVPLAAKPVWPD